MKQQQQIRVLVTGATGFLGSNIIKALKRNPDIECIAACRDRSKLVAFDGEIRQGDLCDPDYRHNVVKNVDVICHAGTWASMWNHKVLEREKFFLPTKDLIDQAISAGVKRFIQTSTVVISKPVQDGSNIDDFSAKQYTGFWPHLDYLMDIDDYMRTNCDRGTQMITLRLGHFVGVGNHLGMLSAIVPRLKTHLVPWLDGGKKRMALVCDNDLGQAFERATVAENLDNYESFNICGKDFPSIREVINFISEQANLPKPLFSVPYSAGYVFAWLMETLHPLLPGSSPFLTRSIVHLCENWVCPNDYAYRKLGYTPKKPWQQAVDEQLAELKNKGYPWRALRQSLTPSNK